MEPSSNPSAVASDPPEVNDYDSFADAYAAENEASLNNAYYERPAILRLAGEVTGRRVLDAGCGSGPLFAALRDRGAIVTGVDLSAGLLAQARRRLGCDADLKLADLTEPLPFSDDSFDDVIASLVLHYFEDWGPTLVEMHRVLRPDGRLIASVHHPTADYCFERLAGRRPDYFATSSWTDEWTMGGHTAQMSFWSRPLHAMTDAFTAADFQISVISEPQPEPEARDLFPEDFDLIATAPTFLFFVLRAI
jgi:SAM-dependent methyltransferase